MSINELELILKKDPIISTFPATTLDSDATTVEHVYSTHARTHISLGDTSKYVDSIFKWVGGENKGAFIGAVVGDYGQGKTSFLVHIWDEARNRKVMAIPPFAWTMVSEMMMATSAWAKYLLQTTHPDLAVKANSLYSTFRERGLKEIAEEVSKKKKKDIDEVLVTLQELEDVGAEVHTSVSAERFLDYCAELTDLIRDAGYAGLLVLLDEPEVASKRLSTAGISEVLFDISNGLLQRKGDYGVFISMPEKFLASAQRSFSSLPARLQGRSCFPRLRDIYGPDFASDLWNRYVQEFNLGELGVKIVHPETLKAIGQVTSSERTDLAYGPRTVVSVFSRMVYKASQKAKPYEPKDFIDDCLNEEVLVTPDYSSKIRQIIQSMQAAILGEEGIKILSAFPNGITQDVLFQLGLEVSSLEEARHSGFVYKKGEYYGLKGLQKIEGAADHDELREAIEDILTEFAPSTTSFINAIEAFTRYLVPLILTPREGHQLLGWDQKNQWYKIADGLLLGEFIGAFTQTEKSYPRRKVVVVLRSIDSEFPLKYISDGTDEPIPDIIIDLQVRWSQDIDLPKQRIGVVCGDQENDEPGEIDLILDFESEPILIKSLNEIIDTALTPLGVLNLIAEMDRRTLSREYDAQWISIRQFYLRELLSQLFGDPTIRSQAQKELDQSVTGSPADLLGDIALYIMQDRHPEYVTIIRQPRWEDKIKDYTSALQNQNIPLAAKRGREKWQASKDDVAKALKTNKMNLDNLFTGYEDLIKIESGGGRTDPAEVQFFIHPLEEDIHDRIMIEKPAGKLNIDGKDCWWIDILEMLPLLLNSGYHVEEVVQIIEIGKSRGSYDTSDHQGRKILFCSPIDPEDMRSQLHDKLTDLKAEMNVIDQLPYYQSSIDVASIEKDIDNLEDEIHFDSIDSILRRIIQENHDRIPGYFDRLDEDLNNIITDITHIESKLRNSRQANDLKSKLTASSKWCSDLKQYITTNLKEIVKEIGSSCTQLRRNINDAKKQYVTNRTGDHLSLITRLVEGTNKLDELDTSLKAISSSEEQLSGYLDEYNNWKRLLNQSDELHDSLLELIEDSSHETKANELINELEGIWEQISAILSTRNIQGLGTHHKFAVQFVEVKEKRQSYLGDLRGVFQNKKEDVNTFLKGLGLPDDRRSSSSFNPIDTQGSYSKLYQDAADLIYQECEFEMSNLKSQLIELLYTQHVIKALDESEVHDLAANAGNIESKLKGIKDEVSDSWIEDTVGSEEKRKSLSKELKKVLERARGSIKDIKTAIRSSRVKKKEALDTNTQEMLELVPEDGQIDLKEIVLQMIEKGQNTANILDESLKSLSDLFRYYKIQLKIEKMKR